MLQRKYKFKNASVVLTTTLVSYISTRTIYRLSGQRNAEEIRTSSKLKLAFPSSRHRVSEKLQELIPVINLPLRFNSSEKILTKYFALLPFKEHTRGS